MKLSIIIPYYQTYELTEKLLNVLIPQLTDATEVILIDDGCNESRLDSFDKIKVTHLDKNYGASYAWNRGLEQATGEYIGFIDSDDMITENYISVLLYAIEKEKADEIVFDYWNVDFNTKNKTREEFPNNKGIWKAIYKREIVPTFEETAKFHTDYPFQRKLQATEHSKSFINIPLYHYHMYREGSITWKGLWGKFKEEENGKFK